MCRKTTPSNLIVNYPCDSKTIRYVNQDLQCLEFRQRKMIPSIIMPRTFVNPKINQLPVYFVALDDSELSARIILTRKMELKERKGLKFSQYILHLN